MKKRILSLVLCFALLFPCFSAHAAGTADDPLISISYINGTFVPGTMSAVKAMLAETMEEHFAGLEKAKSDMTTATIGSGGSISLRTGQTVILLSGSARFDSVSGTIVNATLGAVAGSGALNKCHRYIVCEDSKVTVNILSESDVYFSSSASVTAGKPVSPFTDVVDGQWWYEDILKAYDRGLVNGMTSTTYEPRGNLSLSQAVKLAACMHQLYHEGSVSLENSPTQPWYQSYVDYCIEKGIISEGFASYGEAATRRQFVEIFHAALPESDYVAINNIPDGAIGDISGAGEWVDAVYDFYRAGILTGYTAGAQYAEHDFGADSSITRAEVATIMNRMFDHSARVSFEIE